MGADQPGRGRAMAGCVPWSTVRGFGNVKYFNISYGVLLGVPILHELYAKTVPFMEWFGALDHPFPTTLRWLYGASVSFAIAILMYQWFCPVEIKRFGKNEDEYLEAQYEIYKRALPNHRLNVVLANLDRDLDRDVYERVQSLLKRRDSTIGQSRLQVQCELDDIVNQLHPDAVQRYLLRDYERLNLRNPLARWASFGLYLVGSGILLFLLGWRSYGVLVS